MSNYRKTYQCLRAIHLDTFVKVDGRQVNIAFKGGTLSPRKIFGKYATSDAKIQKALEERGGFGSAYKLIKKEKLDAYKPEPEPKTEPEPKPKPTVPPEGEPEPEPEPEPKPEPDTTVLKDITTVQAAREYLLNNVKGLTGTRVKNRIEVLEVADEFNYEFPNI